MGGDGSFSHTKEHCGSIVPANSSIPLHLTNVVLAAVIALIHFIDRFVAINRLQPGFDS